MSGAGEKGSTTTKTPADFLKSIRGRPVVVKLNSGVDYRGWSLCICTFALLSFPLCMVLFHFAFQTIYFLYFEDCSLFINLLN